MRCFLGIALPPDPQKVLQETLVRLRRTAAPVRWVKPENLHITLKFLGELGEDHLENLKTRLAKVDKPVLQLALDGLGTFPPRGTPRVLWAGVRDVAGSLKRLAAELGRAAVRVGVAREERPYHAHITLGRLRGSTGKEELRSALEEHSPELRSEPFAPEHFTLYQSTLTPEGSVYRRLQDY
jgi:2'-5' RNA ligase